jgi:hypothetical protein
MWARDGMLSRGSALLQQARGTKARNRINDRNWLPLEYPAGHRIAQRRIANVDYLHSSPIFLDALSLGSAISRTVWEKYQAPTGRSMNHWCHAYGTKVTGVTQAGRV